MSFRALAARAAPRAASTTASTATSTASAFCRCGGLVSAGNRWGARSFPRLISPRTSSRHITMAFTTPRPGLKESVLPLPSDPREDVVFDSIYGLRTIILNRPDKLNALNGSMIRKIVPRLVEWANSDLTNVVVVKGAGDRAFCAGGDVLALAEQNAASADGWRQSAKYFEAEYRLNHLIATYNKPYVAFMDGITMGGGVGLSIHAPFRIATERTVFAMPETTIGFFPDVGASYFLPRLNGAIGKYLALTSERVVGANVFYAGIATHYIHSDTVPMLEGRLAELRFRDYDSIADRLRLVNDTLEEYATGLPPFSDQNLQGAIRRAVDRCFSPATIPEITAELERVAREGEVPAEQLPKELKYTRSARRWALAQLQTLHKRSPTSLHVTARLMDEGKRFTVAGAFRREFELAGRFMQHPDFNAGVEAQLRVRKTRERKRENENPEQENENENENKEKEKKKKEPQPPPAPVWSPPTLEDVPFPPTILTNPFFGKAPTADMLTLFNDADYFTNPHEHVGLPTERWLRALLNGLPPERKRLLLRVEDVVDLVVERRGVRQGVRDVVREMARRCLRYLPGGGVEWTGGDVDVVLDVEEEVEVEVEGLEEEEYEGEYTPEGGPMEHRGLVPEDGEGVGTRVPGPRELLMEQRERAREGGGGDGSRL